MPRDLSWSAVATVTEYQTRALETTETCFLQFWNWRCEVWVVLARAPRLQVPPGFSRSGAGALVISPSWSLSGAPPPHAVMPGGGEVGQHTHFEGTQVSSL